MKNIILPLAVVLFVAFLLAYWGYESTILSLLTLILWSAWKLEKGQEEIKEEIKKSNERKIS
jgi:hypothetical protein